MNAPQPTLREIGRIVRPHGVKGAFKVAPDTDDAERFLELERLYVGPDEESATSFDIVSVRIQPSKHGKTILLELDGIADRTEAENFGKPKVFADEADLPELDEDEYFIDELIGLRVDNGRDEIIGEIEDVLEYPGQDRLLIRKDSGPTALVPFVPELIDDIDFDAGVIRFVDLEGLL